MNLTRHALQTNVRLFSIFGIIFELVTIFKIIVYVGGRGGGWAFVLNSTRSCTINGSLHKQQSYCSLNETSIDIPKFNFFL